MYSSEDLERFYFQYQTESLLSGESVLSFCKRNKVPYNIFQKWYKDTRKKIVEVQVDDMPDAGQPADVSSKSTKINEEKKWTDVRDFTDMRCKHSRVLSIIREQLHREPDDGDVFIVMSKNRRIIRMFTYDNRSYSLFEKKFVAGHQFMRVEWNGTEKYRLERRGL